MLVYFVALIGSNPDLYGHGDLILLLKKPPVISPVWITAVGSIGWHVILVFKGYHNKIPLASKKPQNVTGVR